MSVTCAVCRRQPIPHDRSRNFHQFPKISDLRQKWMEILGLTVIKSTWRVCSDHFSSSAFHERNGYNNSQRRLLPTALPNGSNTLPALSEISNVSCDNAVQRIPLANKQNNINSSEFLKEYNGTENTDVSNPSSEAIEIEIYGVPNCVDSDRTCSPDREGLSISSSEPHSLQICTASVEQSHGAHNTSHAEERTSEASLTRKRANTEVYMPTKKFRFKHGTSVQCISRADFGSDEAWNKFLLFTVSKNNLVRAHRKRNLRKETKIENFKELITNLKKELQSSVTRYLEVDRNYVT